MHGSNPSKCVDSVTSKHLVEVLTLCFSMPLFVGESSYHRVSFAPSSAFSHIKLFLLKQGETFFCFQGLPSISVVWEHVG